MFSQEERCLYKNHQLKEVICQLRYPAIAAIAAQEPADFQEAVRQSFPIYEKRLEPLPARVIPVPGQPPRVEQQPPVVNHQFCTADGAYRINLCRDFISLTCRHYAGWEQFAKRMDQALASFIQIYRPSCFQRIGLRYLNAFSKKELELEQTPWRELLRPAYLGLLASEDLQEGAFNRCTQEVDAAIPGGCNLKLHIGPGRIKQGREEAAQEVHMILDMDVSMSGNIPMNLSAGAMQTIHAQAYSVFRDAITDTLHSAMEPQE